MSQNRSNLQSDVLAQLSKIQLERLSYIDFRLYFLGEFRRAHVASRFGIGPAAATRDIALYKEIAPHNLALNNTDKVYRWTPSFVPFFDHDPRRVLIALSQGFGEGVGDDLEPMVRCEIPLTLTVPKMSVLAPITRAIHQRKPVRVGYTSVESGHTEREIVPLALVDTGIRWHLRAFDRRHSEFRDFVFTRMDIPTMMEDGSVRHEETVECDTQWSRVIELELVPHPSHPRPEIVVMDYQIPADGVLRVKVRAANAGYMLRRWTVDCSPDHSQQGLEYALWLRDPLTLYGASNAQLAPGYKDPRSSNAIRAM